MKFHGYEIDFYGKESTDVSIKHILIFACLTLDEFRFNKQKWKKFSSKHPEFKLQSQRSLGRLLDEVEEQVNKSRNAIEQGNIDAARNLLTKYNTIGAGLYSIDDVEPQVEAIVEYQSYNRRAGAYECCYIAHSTIYLCIWIDW